MSIHEARLMRRETVAEGTMAFYFSKPSAFRHQAGQSVLLKLLNPPETDSEGDARTFTIASAPHEAELMIATRMRDTAFKRVLKTAPAETSVRIDGPTMMSLLLVVTAGAVQKLPTKVTGIFIPAAAASGL